MKRYRKLQEDAKIFAITKFAKELLDVRDALGLAMEHVDLEATMESEDNELLKQKFESIVKGQQMTAGVMDRVLKQFDVVMFEPLGEKFDPNCHEAIFTIPEHDEIENDHVGNVMQSGWKIGDRVLRAAKVGIVKK